MVLDEADRLLDMGFEEDVRRIFSLISQNRQTLMWTATWPRAVEGLARDFFSNYVKVNIGSEELTANPNVKQVIEVTTPIGKLTRILDLIKEAKDSKMLIFVGTKFGCEALGRAMFLNGFREVATLHGDKTQPQRDMVMKDFKSNTLRCVVATDVAARGLDVKDIDLVINYDFPPNIETYIHRIGRTARAGKTGTAVSFFTDENIPVIRDLMDVLTAAKQPIPPEIRQLFETRASYKGKGAAPKPQYSRPPLSFSAPRQQSHSHSHSQSNVRDQSTYRSPTPMNRNKHQTEDIEDDLTDFLADTFPEFHGRKDKPSASKKDGFRW
jgi:ATP-dependent RNA helicase DDX5/DBP2